MNVAFIPARGGSKSIHLKNIKPINGRPLIYWTMKAACLCDYIDLVYVATDSDEIKRAVESLIQKNKTVFNKLKIIGRSDESATDYASTEFSMLEFAGQYSFDNIVLIQATSPMLTSSDLDEGFKLFYSEGTDSVLSVVRQKRFIWREEDSGYVIPDNYDIYQRPRRQDFPGFFMENGAFYITSKANLMSSKNRISGNIKAYEMSEDSAFELDEPSDWIIVEDLMNKNGISEKNISIPEIKMFLTDCDGCMTDAGMYYSEFGDELKKFNTRDGMGFSLLQSAGIITGIITSESVDLNKRRAEKLNLNILESGCKNKVDTIKTLCNNYDIPIENVAYIGDDINDIESINGVGFGCCPADAIPEVRHAADYVAKKRGGEGVIREVADLILRN